MSANRILSGLTWLAVALPAAAQGPIVDGRFDEWTPDTVIAQDPMGDADNVFDITEVHAASRGSTLFVHFDTTTTLNLQAGPGEEDTLRLELGLPQDRALTIDFRQRTAYADGNPDNSLGWSELDFSSMTTYAAQRFELKANLEVLGVEVGDSVEIDFAGSDALAQPVLFQMQEPQGTVERRASDRLPCTTFRVASLNTLGGGLLNERQEPIGRVVQAAAADIYCFQEQSSSPQDIADRLAELNPRGDGATWHVVRSSDTIIATPHAVLELPRQGDVAAAIDLQDGGRVVVFSIHPPCCGYIGSGNDEGRIEEMEGIISTVQDLRGANLGQEFLPYRYAPVIIIGDWNLVGSRTPLTLLEEADDVHLTHWLLPHLIGDDVSTWRWLNENPGSFAPGLLDLVAYSAQTLIAKNGFVLDSGELNGQELSDLGLLQDDSRASDHLMLVADFTTYSSGDVDGNGVTDFADILNLLSSWGPCEQCPADVDGSGIVDFADLLVVLANWGSCQ